MIFYFTLGFLLLGAAYGVHRWDRARRKVSVLGQAAYLYATTHPEKWEFSTYYGWCCSAFKLSSLTEFVTPRINDIQVKKYEHQRITNFLDKRRKLRKQEREDKKARELMDFALTEAKKKLEEITNER